MSGKQSYRVLPRWNLEAIESVGVNLRPSPQPWYTLYVQKRPFT